MTKTNTATHIKALRRVETGIVVQVDGREEFLYWDQLKQAASQKSEVAEQYRRLLWEGYGLNEKMFSWSFALLGYVCLADGGTRPQRREVTVRANEYRDALAQVRRWAADRPQFWTPGYFVVETIA